MERETEFETDITPNDNLHHMFQNVITEINEIFKQIQSAVSRRKTILIREVSVIENKLRRQRIERQEDVGTLIRARESLEEVLNSNKYKDLKQDLLLRLDDSLERENEQWKREKFRFVSTGLIQLKESISKFGIIAKNGRDEEVPVFEDDFHLSLQTSHIASPRFQRKFKWELDHTSLTRQASTPLSQFQLNSTLPRPMSSHKLSDLSPRFQGMDPFEKAEGFPNAFTKIPRKNSYNH